MEHAHQEGYKGVFVPAGLSNTSIDRKWNTQVGLTHISLPGSDPVILAGSMLSLRHAFRDRLLWSSRVITETLDEAIYQRR